MYGRIGLGRGGVITDVAVAQRMVKRTDENVTLSAGFYNAMQNVGWTVVCRIVDSK
jgi:hypothetical protein